MTSKESAAPPFRKRRNDPARPLRRSQALPSSLLLAHAPPIASLNSSRRRSGIRTRAEPMRPERKNDNDGGDPARRRLVTGKTHHMRGAVRGRPSSMAAGIMQGREPQWGASRHADNRGGLHRDRKLALEVLARRLSYMRKARRLCGKSQRFQCCFCGRPKDRQISACGLTSSPGILAPCRARLSYPYAARQRDGAHVP
jgi:hypothetical protein